MHKMVDGVRVELTPEEEAQIVAEWAANAAKLPRDAFLAELSPFFRAIIQEIAASTNRTEIQVLASIKTRWQTNIAQ